METVLCADIWKVLVPLYAEKCGGKFFNLLLCEKAALAVVRDSVSRISIPANMRIPDSFVINDGADCALRELTIDADVSRSRHPLKGLSAWDYFRSAVGHCTSLTCRSTDSIGVHRQFDVRKLRRLHLDRLEECMLFFRVVAPVQDFCALDKLDMTICESHSDIFHLVNVLVNDPNSMPNLRKLSFCSGRRTRRSDVSEWTMNLLMIDGIALAQSRCAYTGAGRLQKLLLGGRCRLAAADKLQKECDYAVAAAIAYKDGFNMFLRVKLQVYLVPANMERMDLAGLLHDAAAILVFLTPRQRIKQLVSVMSLANDRTALAWDDTETRAFWLDIIPRFWQIILNLDPNTVSHLDGKWLLKQTDFCDVLFRTFDEILDSEINGDDAHPIPKFRSIAKDAAISQFHPWEWQLRELYTRLCGPGCTALTDFDVGHDESLRRFGGFTKMEVANYCLPMEDVQKFTADDDSGVDLPAEWRCHSVTECIACVYAAKHLPGYPTRKVSYSIAHLLSRLHAIVYFGRVRYDPLDVIFNTGDVEKLAHTSSDFIEKTFDFGLRTSFRANAVTFDLDQRDRDLLFLNDCLLHTLPFIVAPQCTHFGHHRFLACGLTQIADLDWTRFPAVDNDLSILPLAELLSGVLLMSVAQFDPAEPEIPASTKPLYELVMRLLQLYKEKHGKPAVIRPRMDNSPESLAMTPLQKKIMVALKGNKER